LHAVADLSGGLLRPSTIAGYEHGARAITLERFAELCALYGVAADHVLRDVLIPADRKEAVVDLTKLEVVGAGTPIEDGE